MLERADRTRRVTWLSLVGLVLVPVILAAGFLWATWGAGDRLDRVQAAVVNNDEAVTINGQLVPLGRQLAGGLVASKEENFDWTLVDAADASSGLASGRYAAVVTIPENFSAAATSYTGNGDDAEQATIEVQTSQVTAVADSAISQQIAQVARERFNTALTETYLDNIYLGFNKMQKQFTTMADGADKLADGAEGFSDGVTKAANGAGDLATGMGELSRGGSELDTGGYQLATGAKGLATGASGISEGASKYATGVDTFATGLDTYAKGADQYAGGVKKYTGGVHQLSTGASQLAGGLDKLDKGLSQIPTTGGSVDPTQLTAGIKGITGGVVRLDEQLQEIAAGKTPPGTQLPPCPFQSEANAATLCQAYYAGMKDGAAGAAGQLHQAINTKDQQTGFSLVSGAKELSKNADALGKALAAIPAQITQLKDGVAKLADGADKLATGAAQLDKGGAALTKGANQLSDGATKLSDGAGKLSDGADQLSQGAGTFATGASQYADGVSQYATGVDQYTDGVTKAAEGTKQFSLGMTKLSDGAKKLAAGNREFADGLAKGATKVPTYNASQRDNLKTVVANPVAPDQATTKILSEVPATSLLMVLALWLGGLATYLVVQAVASSTLLSSRPSWQLALRAIAPGAAIALVQAIALTAVGQVVLDLSVVKVLEVFLLLVLGGFMFVGLNHALTAWFGGVGRLVSIALVVLTAAGSITSAVPGFFDAILPYSPLTPVLQAVRSVMTDGASIVPQVALILGWLILAIVGSISAVLKQRTISPAQLRLRYA